MGEAWIIDAARTPRGVGKVDKGALANVHPQRILSSVLKALEAPLERARQQPSLDNLIECTKPLIDAIGAAREFPFPLAYLPSGLFDNSTLERYLRKNIERRGMTNDFRVLYRVRGVDGFSAHLTLRVACLDSAYVRFLLRNAPRSDENSST